MMTAFVSITIAKKELKDISDNIAEAKRVRCRYQ